MRLPPSPLERREKLEQLRALEAGMRIDVAHRRQRAARRRYARGPGRGARAPRRITCGRTVPSRCTLTRTVGVRTGTGHDGTQEDRLPGRAGRELPPRAARGLSGLRGGALRDLRGRLRRDQHRRGRTRHDSDRELGRRPRRRYPPPDAAFGPAHRRRAFHAGAASTAGAEGRDARGHQDGRKPRPRARPVPQGDPQARHQAGGRRRHRRLRARGRRSRRQDARRHRHAARRRDLRPRHPGARTSRTRRTTPRASSCCRATRDGRRTATGR